MIVVAVEHLQSYKFLHPGLERAGQFLARPDLSTLTEGRYEIDSDAVFALVSDCEGKGRHGARLEAHRLYIDVQYCLSGKDVLGFRPLAECRTASAAYDEAKDIIFFEDSVREWIALEGHDCAVFFPDDAHAPLGGDGPCKKIVVKIKM